MLAIVKGYAAAYANSWATAPVSSGPRQPENLVVDRPRAAACDIPACLSGGYPYLIRFYDPTNCEA